MRRGLALARDYARKRQAFGDALINHPLHRETLADVAATLEGMLHLSFRAVKLLARREAGTARASDRALLRLLTPIATLTTAKQAVAATSEAIEGFGGAGYVEDTGLPPLLRDAQVLPIWEGRTNVLALDLLLSLQKSGGLGPLQREIDRCGEAVEASRLVGAVQAARRALDAAVDWLAGAQNDGREALARNDARAHDLD